ncbi:MAG: D-alanyl-D-alanine carboxypeptidase [Blautia sp.]|nr:D-alanyl-D-alanine carboxypeptidase [Blautia sp.]
MIAAASDTSAGKKPGSASARGQNNPARPQNTSARPQNTAVRSRSYNARKKRVRRRKILRTVLLLLLLAVLIAAGGFAIYMLRGRNFTTPNIPFSLSREYANSLVKKEAQKAEGFASDLCVVTNEVPLETSTLADSQAGLLLDLDNHSVMYAQKPFEKVYPASITKIVTAILLLKSGRLDETVTIQPEDLMLEEGSQVCGFWSGDQVTLNQLLHCLLVYSGNDAALAIARTIGGSTEKFVDMMNEYVQSIGCTGTHYTSPHGLQDENHYTTPYDIYLMLREALKYPQFTEITQQPSYVCNYTHQDGSEGVVRLESTDHYLTGESTPPKNVTVLGGKTGYTSIAGNCLALLSQNAFGKPFVSVVMGANTKDVLYAQMNSLLQAIN